MRSSAWLTHDGSDGGMPEVRLHDDAVLLHDVSAAAWIADTLLPWTRGLARVGAVVPATFPRYARIFHPATSASGDPVSWREAAAWAGRVHHPEMQWEAIANPHGSPDALRPWSRKPAEGRLPDAVRAALAETLAEWTGTPERCYACVWEGWGGLSEHFPRAQKVRLPQRGYFLIEAPLSAIGDGVLEGLGALHAGPALWWPADRSWCVATEIDYRWTYVGAAPNCIDAVLDDVRIEAIETSPTHRGDWASDEINGPIAPW